MRAPARCPYPWAPNLEQLVTAVCLPIEMNAGTSEVLWGRFRSRRDAEARSQLLNQHLDLVRLLARRLFSRIGGAVEMDDLVSSGSLGLVQALESFDPDRGNTFPTYASRRIHGAMLDELRRRDWVPRSVRSRARQLNGAVARAEAGLGRAASPVEVAAVLGLDQKTYEDWRQAVDNAVLLSMEDVAGNPAGTPLAEAIGDPAAVHPLEELNDEESRELLAEALGTLAERDRTVLMLYYYEEMNLREIAAVLGLTESRISQIRSAALDRLRTALRRLGVEAA